MRTRADSQLRPVESSAKTTYKMMGPFCGTFSAPSTSISLKKEHMADFDRATKGLWVNPNGMVWSRGV